MKAVRGKEIHRACYICSRHWYSSSCDYFIFGSFRLLKGDHSSRHSFVFETLAAAGISVTAFDLRGHGNSPIVDEPLTVHTLLVCSFSYLSSLSFTYLTGEGRSFASSETAQEEDKDSSLSLCNWYWSSSCICICFAK